MFVARSEPAAAVPLHDFPPSAAYALREAMPHPRALAALGTVLCAYRPGLGDALEGWRRARRVALRQRLDSDGLDECLCFFDAQGAGCWRLHLLPDSDFLAWDALAERLPALAPGPAEGLAERMWRRLAGRLRDDSWRSLAVRLQPEGPLGQGLGARTAPISETGLRMVERLAREG